MMKSYEERLPLIDAAIEKLKEWPSGSGDCEILYSGRVFYFTRGEKYNPRGNYKRICTRDEFEQRKAELAAKGQDMNNDWYEKGELPPVGERCISVDPSGIECSGEIVKHSSDGECALFVRDDESTVFWQKEFRPLRTETDKMVDAVEQILDGCENVSNRAIAHAIVNAGYRKTKPMSEGEFVAECLKSMNLKEYDYAEQNAFCEMARSIHRAGCRFIEQVKV